MISHGCCSGQRPPILLTSWHILRLETILNWNRCSTSVACSRILFFGCYDPQISLQLLLNFQPSSLVQSGRPFETPKNHNLTARQDLEPITWVSQVF